MTPLYGAGSCWEPILLHWRPRWSHEAVKRASTPTGAGKRYLDSHLPNVCGTAATRPRLLGNWVVTSRGGLLCPSDMLHKASTGLVP
jgi:hypothetical protein